MIREMSVCGSFYPARESELERFFEHFNTLALEYNADLSHKSKAVIVPHAGYIYSGYTANLAYRVLAQGECKKFVIIGPSHRVGFEGVSLGDFSGYATPFGTLASDPKMAIELKERFSLNFYPQAHQEHSTEVQFPFLHYYIPDASIVELVYSKEDPAHLCKIIDYILTCEDWGVIISTDFSHFYTLEEANQLDRLCIDAFNSLSPSKLHTGCEACGKIGVEAMLQSATKAVLKPHLLDYRTSADASDDTSRVVGYMSGCFCKNENL